MDAAATARTRRSGQPKVLNFSPLSHLNFPSIHSQRTLLGPSQRLTVFLRRLKPGSMKINDKIM